jgi:hypothetical protein
MWSILPGQLFFNGSPPSKSDLTLKTSGLVGGAGKVTWWCTGLHPPLPERSYKSEPLEHLEAQVIPPSLLKSSSESATIQ